jgi:hypothetical protein
MGAALDVCLNRHLSNALGVLLGPRLLSAAHGVPAPALRLSRWLSIPLGHLFGTDDLRVVCLNRLIGTLLDVPVGCWFLSY